MQVYADNAATTAMSQTAINAMLPYFDKIYGNPSSLHSVGQAAKEALDAARETVAACLGCEPREIIFTSGGSEADNQAIISAARYGAKKGKKHIITTAFEHHAVLHTVARLEKEGFEVTYLPVDKHGMVELDVLEKAIRPDTAMVSIMFANNEIGKLCKEKGVIFHTDAVQAYGHVPVDVKAMNIDILSISGHKINAPKGVGAIYIRKGVLLNQLITGGGQEKGRRAGTENIASIVGLGEAARIKRETMEEETAYLRKLSRKLIDGVTKFPQTILTGHPEQRLPGTCSFCINAIEGESLVLMLDFNGICASTGSACSTGSLDPSHVLLGIGLSHEIAHGSLRLTLGMQNTEEDVDYILERLEQVVKTLRAMSPIWHE